MAYTELQRYYAVDPQYTSIDVTGLGGVLCVALEVNYVSAGTVVLTEESFPKFLFGLCRQDHPVALRILLDTGEVKTVANVPADTHYLADMNGDFFHISTMTETT